MRTAVRIAEPVAITRLALPFSVSAPVRFSVSFTPLRLRSRQNQTSVSRDPARLVPARPVGIPISATSSPTESARSSPCRRYGGSR